jgi:hypothetical protein
MRAHIVDSPFVNAIRDRERGLEPAEKSLDLESLDPAARGSSRG